MGLPNRLNLARNARQECPPAILAAAARQTALGGSAEGFCHCTVSASGRKSANRFKITG
ncbi:MAG: hypothetical protein ACJAVZ_002623 [Afipia broomeae]|jgi:hypothetical protein